MVRSEQEHENKAVSSLLPSLLGLPFESGFAAANCTTTGRRRIVQGTVLYGPRDLRFEERPEPTIVEPTDALIRLPATSVCGSDLWPYRGIAPIDGPTP